MTEIVAQFATVTPTYAGDADREHTEGLRPPVLKALLRFWWRAGSAFVTDSSQPSGWRLVMSAELARREALLFGSTDSGQGVRIIPRGDLKPNAIDTAGTEERNQMHTYMAYGAVSWEPERRAPVTRVARIKPGYAPSFRIVFPPRFSEQDRFEIRKALWLLGAFGAFGSRARRGWGSLMLKSRLEGLPSLHDATSTNDLSTRLANGLQTVLGAPKASLPQIDPEFSAFSHDSALALGDPKPTWDQAFRVAYNDFSDYRRLLGAHKDHRPGDVGPDHADRAKWASRGATSADYTPFGAAFGLPHNAQFSPPGRGARVEVGVNSDLKGRRASPLFIKVLEIGTGPQRRFLPLFLWLPGQFLPPDEDVYVKANGRAPVKLQWGGDQAIYAFFYGTKTTPIPGVTWRGLLELPLQGYQEVAW